MSEFDWTEEESRAHERVWQKLFDATVAFLSQFGRRDPFGDEPRVRGDFDVVEDDWGWDVVKAEVNLPLIRPEVIKGLQALLVSFPEWMISVRATFPEGVEDPGMGIFIYADRIDDDLKREYLPPEFLNLRFD